MNTFKKTIAAALAAVTLAFAVAPTPAEAHRFPRGVGFAGALIGDLLLGGIAAAAAEHEHRCGVTRQPMFDAYGNFLGYRRVAYC